MVAVPFILRSPTARAVRLLVTPVAWLIVGTIEAPLANVVVSAEMTPLLKVGAR
jgi:hypothetical protein